MRNSIHYNKITKQKLAEFANDVKQKFKIGDLITNGILVGKIDEIHELGYHAYFGDHYADVPDIKNWHIWTINDAKDGDVLVSELCDSIILFKGIKNNNIDFYCDYDFSENNVPGDRFAINNGGQHYGSVEDSKDFHPATKEQCDTLMKAMKEAGYTFDFKKKELNKVEQNIELTDFESALFTAFSDAWQQYLGGEEVNVAQWAKEHSAELLEAAMKEHNEWSEEDEDYYDAIIAKLEVTQEDAALTDNQMNFLKSLKCKIKLKQEWSEEDKRCLTNVISACTQMSDEDYDYLQGYIDAINWLKSLRPQSKQELNEEDERIRNALIGLVEEIKNQPLKRFEDWDGYISWLKSLRPQWKPTKEQIRALTFACIKNVDIDKSSIKALYDLKEQLKQLL